VAFEVFKAGALEKGAGCEVQEPGADDAATSPEFCYIGKVEIVLVVLWIAKWRCFGIDGLLLISDVSVVEDVQSFSVGGHDPVLDTVVDHFDKVATTMWPTEEVALLGGAAYLLASRSAGYCTDSRSKRREDGVKALGNFGLAADHEAVAAFESPDATTSTNVHVVDAVRLKCFSTTDIVVIVGVAAIDDDIIGREKWDEGFQVGIYGGNGYHEPDGTWFGKLVYEIFQ
jgi:hypothetical protein